VILDYHGGDLNGFWLLRGDPEKLGRLRMAPEFTRLVLRCGVICESVGVLNAWLDAGGRWALGAWKEAIADLI
jgi:hypothetical protein